MKSRTMVLIVVLFLSTVTVARQLTLAAADAPRTKALCVVHCDPVPERAFGANWAMLEDLVSTADAHGAKLSLHFTGSYAAMALRAGKTDTVRRWLAAGHGTGTHPHPEIAHGDRWQPQVPWIGFPQDKVTQAMKQATDAVIGAQAHRMKHDTIASLEDTIRSALDAQASWLEIWHFDMYHEGFAEIPKRYENRFRRAATAIAK